jgi:hypothetical protein
MPKYIYQLWLNDKFCLYENTNLYYVFHEYLSYNTEHLVIKKKLHDYNKKFDLYLETIIYNKNNNTFVSDNQKVYTIDGVTFLNNFSTSSYVNQTTNNYVNQPTIKTIDKIDIKKPVIHKVKIVDYETNKQVPNPNDKLNNDELVEMEVDEDKLKELEKLIENMENLRDDQLENLQKEEEIIQQKEMEERNVQMKNRVRDDKKKELRNIYEADKNLYLTFVEIINEINKINENKKNNVIDTRKVHELKKTELRARIIANNNDNFEIPVMFAHKFPIFDFLDKQQLLNREYSFLAYKMIYYTNYETKTESRRFFGDEVYLLNDEEEKIYNKEFTENEKNLIDTFKTQLSEKKLDIDKIISSKFEETKNPKSKLGSSSQLLCDCDSDTDSETDSEQDIIVNF